MIGNFFSTFIIILSEVFYESLKTAQVTPDGMQGYLSMFPLHLG